MRPNPIKLGARYGRLTAKEFLIIKYPSGTRRQVKVVCDCGNEKLVLAMQLAKGSTRSCGCLHKEQLVARNLTHGQTRGNNTTPEYHSWAAMKERCLNPKSKNYPEWGGRGITLCERWMKFENFFADMGKKPSPQHSIDRIDNNGPYEKKNCRWATTLEQVYNRRPERFICLTYRGRTQTIHGWSRELGLKKCTVYYRYFQNYPVEKILSRESLVTGNRIAN